MSRRVLAAAALVAALTVLAPGGARAQPVRPVSVAWQAGGVPAVTFAYHDLFDAETRRKLQSGLQVSLALRAFLFREAGAEPAAVGAVSCRVIYDIWEEVYVVDVVTAAGARAAQAPTLEGVEALCGEANGLALAVQGAPLTRGERYYVAAIAEVDPLTPDMVERIQRWVARPGNTAPLSQGGSFFGTFVTLFVTPSVGQADRTLRFRSAALVAP